MDLLIVCYLTPGCTLHPFLKRPVSRLFLCLLRSFNLPLQKPRSETVRGSLRLLTSSACRLQGECRKAVPSEGCPGPDMQLVTQQVIQCAYDIAKAAKQLVTITTKENTN